MPCDTQSLLAEAKCFLCLSDPQLEAIKTSLLCEYAENPPTPDTPTDPDLDFTESLPGVDITWESPSEPDNFEVWRSQDFGAYALFSTVAGNVTTATDTDPFSVGTYTSYKIRAVNGSTPSPFTSPVSVANDFMVTGTVSNTDLLLIFGDLTGSGATVSVSIPNLKKVAIVIFSNEASMTTLSLPALTSSSDFTLAGCTALTNLTLASLQTMESVNINDCGALTTSAFPALATVTGLNGFDINNCGALTTISLPSLVSVTARLTIHDNGSVVSLSLPALTSVGANTEINFNTLTSTSIPVLVITNGTTVDFRDNQLDATSINQILRRGVLSGTTTCTYSLDGGSNSAPTGQGIVDAATLTTAGNTVTTN